MNQIDILDGIENTKMRELRQYKLVLLVSLSISLLATLTLISMGIGLIDMKGFELASIFIISSLSIVVYSNENASKLSREIEIENRKIVARSIVFGKFYTTKIEAEQLANSFGLKEYDQYSIEYHYSIDANWKGKSCYSILIKE